MSRFHIVVSATTTNETSLSSLKLAIDDLLSKKSDAFELKDVVIECQEGLEADESTDDEELLLAYDDVFELKPARPDFL